MGAQLNALIAQGGANIQSPLNRFVQAKKESQAANERQVANALNQRVQMQNMSVQQQQNSRQQQAQNVAMMDAYKKAITPAMLDLETIPSEQRPAYYQQKVLPYLQMVGQKMGLQQSPDAQYDNAKFNMFMQGVDKPEKFTQKVTPEGIRFQQSTTTGKQIEGINPDAAKTKDNFVVGYDEKGNPINQVDTTTGRVYEHPNAPKASGDKSHAFSTIYDENKKPLFQVDSVTGRAYAHPDAVDKSVVGKPGDFTDPKNKITKARTEAYDADTRSIAAIDEMMEMAADPNLYSGVTGDALSAANSLFEQYRQLKGLKGSILTPDGRINKDLIDPDAHTNTWLKKAAMKGDAYRSALIQAAYTVAQANGNVRVTDKDFEFAEEMLGSSGDKESLLHTLDLKRKRTIRDHNISEDAYSKGYGGMGYKPMYLGEWKSPVDRNTPDSVGGAATNEIDNEADKALNRAGW